MTKEKADCFGAWYFLGNWASTNKLNFSLQLPGNQHQGLNCLSGGNKTLKARTTPKCWKDLGHIQNFFRISGKKSKIGYYSRDFVYFCFMAIYWHKILFALFSTAGWDLLHQKTYQRCKKSKLEINYISSVLKLPYVQHCCTHCNKSHETTDKALWACH